MASNLGKKVVAGTTVAAVGLTGGHVALHFLGPRGVAGAHGAVIDMDEDNGMLLRDLRNRPAFVNYFDSPQDMRMSVSISTTEAIPSTLQNKWSQLTKYRQEDVSRKLAPEDYRPIDAGSAQVIREFFREFEELSGIHVEVRENDPHADIVIGGYTSHDEYIGFGSFPQEIPAVSKLPQNRGFLMLDTNYLARKLAEGNREAVLALVSHEFGHNLGLLHPFDKLVHTGANEKQQDSISRMAYSNITFPAIAGTTINTGFGPLDIRVIREAVRELGHEPPAIHPDNDTYLLSELAETQRKQARARSGRLDNIPALSLVDSGGENTLVGTAGDDLLVTEAGDCGLLNRQEQSISLLRDGQPYCLAEGEFSVVRSGDGNDLILAARGSEQHVYLGTGNKDVGLFERDMGDKTIIRDKGAAGDNGEITLTLHASLLHGMTVSAENAGNDVMLLFFAPSGREVGRITLHEQATGRGIDQLRVIDDQGQDIARYEVAELQTASQWQTDIVTPLSETIDTIARESLRAEVAKARQQWAGGAGEWTSRGVPLLAEGAQDKRPAPKDYPNEDNQPHHIDAVLRRRREEETHHGKLRR